jgi:hypothetical protein
MRLVDIGRRITPEEHQDRNLLVEAGLDLPLAQQRQDEIDAERLVRQTLQPLDLSANELARKGGGAEDAASACVRDGRYEFGAGRRTDASAKDRMLDPKGAAEVSLQHGASSCSSAWRRA